MKNQMLNPTLKGIFLALILTSSTIVAGMPSIYAAESVDAKSTAFEETTIIEFENTGDTPINTFRMWLGSDFNFKSFKTERGWTGEKTPQGVIVFTSEEFVMPGESVKFGVKTDKEKPGINWKALDKGDKQLAIGKTLAEDLPKPVKQKQQSSKQTSTSKGVLADSQFRIIPEKPNVGSSIRVTGENFAPTQEFDLYLDDKKLDSFVTNDAGQFITTTEIPDDAEAERVEFIVKGKQGNKKTVSLRLGGAEDRVPESTDIKLTIKGLSSEIHRGDELQIYGTAQPKSTVTGTIINPDGKEITTKSAEVDAKGNWKLKEPIIVSSEAPLGKYTAKISDGKEQIIRTYEVKTDKVILLTPSELKYEIGDTMLFNGTVIPNKPLEVIIEDPIDQEVFSDIITVDESGYVEVELKTTNDFEEGTYTLFASQDGNLELIYAGLGELPQIPVDVVFDKLNYKKTEDAQMIIRGEASETVSLLIVDPSDKPVGETIPIKIGPDGRGKHTIDLDKFSSGVYTAVVSKGTARSSTIFTVGLQTGSGDININTTKVEYDTGDQILVLGETNPNSLLTLTLFDPDGNKIKERESFSNKNGKISNNSFRIPSEASPGTWSIRAESGSNFDIVEFEVTGVNQEGMIVFVEKGDNFGGVGDSITIRIIGAAQTVEIDIISSEGENVQHLSFPASDEGELKIPWIIPNDLEAGTYTVKAKDAHDSAETTFEI